MPILSIVIISKTVLSDINLWLYDCKRKKLNNQKKCPYCKECFTEKYYNCYVVKRENKEEIYTLFCNDKMNLMDGLPDPNSISSNEELMNLPSHLPVTRRAVFNNNRMQICAQKRKTDN